MSLSCESTPTGIPIIDCETCGHRHPESREGRLVTRLRHRLAAWLCRQFARLA